jgi:FkbM family methyltransferase
MKILFDIGANRGKFSLANKDSFDLFILVEPNNEYNKQIENYGLSNFYIENMIVSNEKNIDFYLCDTISTCDRDWIENSRFSKKYSWIKSNPIPTITIDQLVDKYGFPNFIKIDVEGYELNVVKSMTKKYNDLCFEWAEEKQNEILQTLEYLNNLGYKLFHLHQQDQYDYFPREEYYESYESIFKKIKKLSPSRKQKWGMIFCK